VRELSTLERDQCLRKVSTVLIFVLFLLIIVVVRLVVLLLGVVLFVVLFLLFGIRIEKLPKLDRERSGLAVIAELLA
jgi:hypothetical protein